MSLATESNPHLIREGTKMNMSEISQLELDLLLLFYTYSNQFGTVDISYCANYAANKMGVFISRTPFQLEQQHIDALMDHGLIPDTRELLTVVRLNKPKIRARRVKKPKNPD
jgi:hypothetical protein